MLQAPIAICGYWLADVDSLMLHCLNIEADCFAGLIIFSMGYRLDMSSRKIYLNQNVIFSVFTHVSQMHKNIPRSCNHILHQMYERFLYAPQYN